VQESEHGYDSDIIDREGLNTRTHTHTIMVFFSRAIVYRFSFFVYERRGVIIVSIIIVVMFFVLYSFPRTEGEGEKKEWGYYFLVSPISVTSTY
jgi:hypothetical protein